MTDEGQQNLGAWLGILMMALAWLLVLPAGAPARSQGDYARAEVLIEAEELKTRLDRQDPNLRLIDFRHKAKYYLGHIPGAVQVWRPQITDRGQTVPGLPPPRAQVERVLGRLGVSAGDTIVIYSDQCDHTHLWWLLAYYGFPLDRLKLLDGGLEAWKSKGYPTQLTAPAAQPAIFRFPGAGREFLLAGREQVKAALAPPAPGSVILDVRSGDQYRGERTREGAARRGHIPGAVWIFWQTGRVQAGPDKGCWQGAAEIRQLYGERGVTPDEDIYLYSHTNHCATHTLVSLYLAGYPLEKLHVYGGSWVDWSRSGEPVATGSPGAAQ